MADDFRDEFVDVLSRFNEDDRSIARNSRSYGLNVGGVISVLLDTPGKILYFPPGNYRLEARTDNVPYVCAAGVQLFFANGALLRLDDGVDLVIQGTIRAGSYQIFGYNPTIRLLSRQGEPQIDLDHRDLALRFRTWPTYEGAGRIVFDTDDIPQVHPEWWGARPSVDGADAFQAAFYAACTGRRGRFPIPVVLSGNYEFGRTLEIHAPPDRDGKPQSVCLILRGGAGIAGSYGLVRKHYGNDPIGEREVALRIHPGVDFDIRDLKIEVVDELYGCLDVLCSDRRASA